MALTPTPFTLDPYDQTMLNLEHAASLRLTAGPEFDDVLLEAAGHAVVASLRQDAATPGSTLRPRSDRVWVTRYLKSQSSRWQAIAAVPAHVFDRHLAHPTPRPHPWTDFADRLLGCLEHRQFNAGFVCRNGNRAVAQLSPHPRH